LDIEEARASLLAYYAEKFPGIGRAAVEAAAEAALAAALRGEDGDAMKAAGHAEVARLSGSGAPGAYAGGQSPRGQFARGESAGGQSTRGRSPQGSYTQAAAAASPPLRNAPASGGIGAAEAGAVRRPRGPAPTAAVAPQWANELAAGLFAAPARWGWRAAPEPAATALTPPPSTSRPVWTEMPRPDISPLTAALRKARNRLQRRVALSVILGAAFAIYLPQIKTRVDGADNQQREIAFVVAAVVGLILLISLIGAIRAVRAASRSIRAFEGPYLALRAAEKERHEHALREWDAAARRHREEAERAAKEAAQRANGPLWFPVAPAVEPTRIDVFGGDSQRHGWSSLLVTLGTSFLAAGDRVTVLDFTGRDVGGGLLNVARAHGLPTRGLSFDGGPGADLIGGLPPRGVADTLAYAVTGRHEGADQRQERALAAQVLYTVAQCLGGQVTLARLAAGIRVLLRGDDAAGLTAQEVGELVGRVGDIDQSEWTTRQLRFLASQLDVLLDFAPATGYPPPLWGGGAVSLIVTPGGRDDRKDLLDRLLVQLAQHAMDFGTWSGGLLVVAGADHLGAQTLAILSDHARHAGVRLALLIDQPQGDMEKNAGTGGAVCFMKMYNHRDAAVAAEFIGKGYTFVVNQITRQTGKTFTDGGGDTFNASTTTGSGSKQRASGLAGRSNSMSDSRGQTWSATRNWSTADNVSTSTGTARVYEFVVDPQEILGMPETAFILVDNTGQGRRVTMVDGNPGISLLPRVSRTPA